jgi:HK97 family phage major capsid protein
MDHNQIQAELDRISDQVKSFAQGAMKEIKATGTMSQQTRDELSRLSSAHAELSARLQTAEQILARYQGGAGGPSSFGAGGPSLGLQAVDRLSEDPAFMAAAAASQRGMKPSQFSARVNLDGSIRAALTSFSDGAIASEGAARGYTGLQIVGPVQPVPRLLDLLPKRETARDTIEFIQLAAEGVVSEQINPGDTKAELDFEGELARAEIVTIAGWTAAAKQILSDNPQLGQTIDNTMRGKVLTRLEHRIINGTGGQGQIDGLLSQAVTLVPTIGQTPADVVGEAMVRMANYGYQPGLVLLNPLDWYKIQLTRTNTEGAYLFGSPTAPVPPALWNAAIVASPSVPEGRGLTVDTRFVTVLDRQQLTVMISNSHEDFFVRNLVAILAELRAGLEVTDQSAVYKFDIDHNVSS